jgi:diguanylate cyclase (GGDEF)-like protein
LGALLETLIARVQSADADHGPPSAADRALIERARSLVSATTATLQGLQSRVQSLQHLAVTDELTGLLNRRGFAREVEQALARAHRYGDEGALIYIDIDAFKQINDRHGHAAGDAVLRHVAQVLNASVRCTDHVGRLGGDEFAVLLARATIAGSRKRAAQLAQRLQGTEIHHNGQVITVHASVGIQVYGREHCLDAEALVAGADSAMYAEKDWRRVRRAPHKLALAG